MDHWMSMYVDNELSLEEKIGFVKRVRKDEQYYIVTLSLLNQEKELHRLLRPPVGEESVLPSRKKFRLVQTGWAVAAVLALAVVVLLTSGGLFPGQMQNELGATSRTLTQHRFVIQYGGEGTVEITGSFSGWQKLPLKSAGHSGYWEITLPLASGEHRYAFLVNGTTSLPDPTVLAQEADDFGAVNSILQIGQGNARI